MPVTHEDLSPARRGNRVAMKLGVALMIFSILCGLGCFILCLVSEATRSEVIWIGGDGEKDENRECVYSGSGKTPLACGLGAFLVLAVAMVAKHSYILVVLSEPDPSANLTPWMPASYRSLTLQACFIFAAAWICFAVGEVLLLIGIGVESGHISQWTRPRSNCLVVGTGLFAAAGVFGLATVLLAGGLYLTLVHAQRVRQEHAAVRREVMEISFLYAASPPNRLSHNIFGNSLPPVNQNHPSRPERSSEGSPATDNKSQGGTSFLLHTVSLS